MIKFSSVNEAEEKLSEALSSDSWREYFLLHQDGDIITLYSDKDIIRKSNRITPSGGFDSIEQAEQTFRKLVAEKTNEIARWVVDGDNKPLKLFFTLDEPVGYCFDSDGNEHEGEKIQLCMRRDRKDVTHYGIFVSHFHPVFEFIDA